MPPRRSRGVLADLRDYVAHQPEIPTLIEFPSESERENYSKRILQRLGISVDRYAVLNIHRIGIRAPVKFVHEEVLRWSGQSPYWPNDLATVESIDGSREHVKILLLGRITRAARRWSRRLAPELGTLFRLKALRFQHGPHPADFDNARFLLYECSGGYPIGVFCIYVRSPVRDQGETEETQVFFTVGFSFYGRQSSPRLLSKVWETLHNRVTANVLNRFRRSCETEFRAFTSAEGFGREAGAREISTWARADLLADPPPATPDEER